MSHADIDIDREALQRFLSATAPELGTIQTVERFSGGQSNPTYKVVTDRDQFVLRRRPFGELLPSAHAIDREYRLISALQPTKVPVPAPRLYCEDRSAIGVEFYLVSFVDGDVCWDHALPGVAPERRRAMYESLLGALADLHSLDYPALGLSDFGKPGNYVARQISRWSRQYEASKTEPIPEMEELIAWLPENLPEQTETCIVHGDYRIDNVIFGKGGSEIISVLDWEIATLGDPIADLSYFLMSWELSPIHFRGLGGLDLAGTGIPGVSECVDIYCARRGIPRPEDFEIYTIFNLFRLVAILESLTARARAGTAASAEAEERGRQAIPIAKLAAKMVKAREARPKWQ